MVKASADDQEIIVDYEGLNWSTLRELPMPSDASILKAAVLGGVSGRAGLNGFREAAALGRI